MLISIVNWTAPLTRIKLSFSERVQFPILSYPLPTVRVFAVRIPTFGSFTHSHTQSVKHEIIIEIRKEIKLQSKVTIAGVNKPMTMTMTIPPANNYYVHQEM